MPLLARDGVIYVWARGGEAGYWTVKPHDGAARLLLAVSEGSRQPGVSLAVGEGTLFFPLWERAAELWVADIRFRR